jgi:hypothetical protein
MLEFRFLKLNGLIKASWAAHVWSQLLTLADNYFGSRMFRSRSRYFRHSSVSFPPFCRIYFPSSSATPLAPAEPPSAAACF